MRTRTVETSATPKKPLAAFIAHFWLPLSIVFICLIAQIAGDFEYLRYQRTLLSSDEFWRFISAHFIHLNWTHWALNMLGFVLIYVLLGYFYPPWQWLVITLSSGLGVSVGLLLLNPELIWYVGFSGALHGLIIAVAMAATATHERRFGLVLLLCVVGKLVWEQWAGALPGSAEITGGPVVVDAHLYGAITGLVYAVLVLLVTLQQSRSN